MKKQMKHSLRIPLFLLAVILFTSAIPPIKNDKTTPSSSKNGMTLREVLKLSPKQYTEITGEKLSFKDKIAFSSMKREIRKDKSLNLDSKVNLDVIITDSSGNFDIRDFLTGGILGCFIGAMSVAFLYKFFQ